MQASEVAAAMTAGGTGPVRLTGVVVEGDLCLPHAEFSAHVSFRDCEFTGKLDLSFATLRRGLSMEGCRFQQVSLRGAVVSGDAIFDGSEFGTAGCELEGIRVEGAASFRPANGNRVMFHGKANFRYARFSSEAAFHSAIFQDYADFYFAEFCGPALFTSHQEPGAPPRKAPVWFLGQVRFRDAHVAGEANFRGARFCGNADFTRVRIDGAALFNRSGPEKLAVKFSKTPRVPGAEQLDEISFRGARFGAETTFTGCRFDGYTTFNACRAAVYLMFAGAEFCDVVTFREASSRTIYFDRTPEKERDPAKFALGIDLRGCAYRRIYADFGTLREAMNRGLIAGADNDRQPYLQLESVLRSMGQEKEADRTYLDFRRAEHKHARGMRKVRSGLSGVLTNYGVGPRIFCWALLVWLVGTLVFHSEDAVVRKAEPGEPAAKTENHARLSWPRAAGFSLAQFLPVEIPAGAGYKASTAFLWRAAGVTYDTYASAHHLIGWVLVPLAVAVLSGVMSRKAPKESGGGSEGGSG